MDEYEDYDYGADYGNDYGGDYGGDYGSDYGDDYGGDYRDGDGGDEDAGDEYQYYEQQQEYGVGYRQLEQIGMPILPGQQLRTGIGGRGRLKDIEQKLRFTGLDHKEKFLAGVNAMMTTVDIQDLNLDNENKSEIINNIDTLTFIQFKNPLYYILGYYISDCVPPEMSPHRRQKVDNVIKILKNNLRVSQRQQDEDIIVNQMLANVLKYARFWQINNMFIIK